MEDQFGATERMLDNLWERMKRNTRKTLFVLFVIAAMIFIGGFLYSWGSNLAPARIEVPNTSQKINQTSTVGLGGKISLDGRLILDVIVPFGKSSEWRPDMEITLAEGITYAVATATPIVNIPIPSEFPPSYYFNRTLYKTNVITAGDKTFAVTLLDVVGNVHPNGNTYQYTFNIAEK